ncbi:hypothetical protein ACWD4O_16425 [Streptomyces sp. NPDC002623]
MIAPARCKRPVDPSTRPEETRALIAESPAAEPPLTSEPPLPDAEPLTSEPPFAADPDSTRP